jgi:hypothetical protein
MRLSIAKGEAQECINFSLQYFEFKLYELIVLADLAESLAKRRTP